MNKSINKLDVLIGKKLALVFWGIESGAELVLRYVNKGITSEQMLVAAQHVS
jgi:hypothetical protein